MAQNLLSRSVPRVEYDHRAREARWKLERLERLLVDGVVKKSRPVRLLRFLGLRASGSAAQSNRTAGSSSDRRPCGITRSQPYQWVNRPASTLLRGSCQHPAKTRDPERNLSLFLAPRRVDSVHSMARSCGRAQVRAAS